MDKPRVDFETFKRVGLKVGTVMGVQGHATMPGLAIVTVRLDQDVEALAAASAVPRSLAGQRVVVATGLRPIAVAGKQFSCYLLSATVEPGAAALVVEAAIPDGSGLY